jgi:DNA-binding NarL/FixJ family response regulator
VLEAAGFDVVGEAETGHEAIELATAMEPDVVLMDLHLPDINGAEATKRLLRDSPSVRVCVLTMFDDDDSVFASLRAGALGYLLKGSGTESIARAVHTVANGDALYSETIARRLQSFFNDEVGPRPVPFPELTPREREVLEFIAQGRTNPEISRAIGLSEKTIRNLVSSVFSKLHVAERSHAIVRAREAGLGSGA